MFKINKIVLLSLFLFSTVAAFGFGGTGFNKYRMYFIPPEYDPVFIQNLEDCKESEFIDWYGIHKYIILGKDRRNACHYKSQYNPWLKINKNEWNDYKECFFSPTQIQELTTALKDEGFINHTQVSTYNVGAYKVTSTNVEYLLTSYEYYGTCKLIKKNNYKI